MNLSPHKFSKSLDAAGISLSALCLMHCLVFPAAAAATPLLAPGAMEALGLGHEWHLGLFLIAAPVSILGLAWGMRVTRSGWGVFAAGMLGLALMALGVSHMFSEIVEIGLTITGVSIVALAHAMNWRARTKAGHDHKAACELCDERVASQ